MYLKIQNTEELILCVAHLKKHTPTWLAIDTEFHRETTYFPILSLIQIATDSQIWIIDALSCSDLTPLKSLLEDLSIAKIFHAGDQDWAILSQSIGAKTNPIFDTQIMGGFAKLGGASSLESLVSALLETPIDKSQQKTDWLKRPLSQDQLEYAARDASYVGKIYTVLKQRLIDLQRYDWVIQEMEALFDKYSNPIFSRDWLKICFTGCKWPVPFYAMELSKWREEWAKKLNIPKRYVIADALLEKFLREMSISSVRTDSCLPQVYDDLVKFWDTLESQSSDQKVDRLSIEQAVKMHHQQIPTSTLKLIKKWQIKIKQAAKDLDIPSHFLLNKNQLNQLINGDESVISGWRKDFLQ